MNETELIKMVTDLRQKVESAKMQKAQLEGRWQEVTTNLKSRFGATSLKDARALEESKIAEHGKLIKMAIDTLNTLKEKHGSAIFP